MLARQARFVDWGGCPGMIWPQSGDSVDLLNAAPVIARTRELLAARPPIRRVFSARGAHGWLYESHLGTEGLITERAVYADVLARLSWFGPSTDDELLATLDLQLLPIARALAREVRRVGAFGDDAFPASLVRVAEHSCTVRRHVAEP